MRITPSGVLLLMAIDVLVVALVAWPFIRGRFNQPEPAVTSSPSATLDPPTPSPTLTLTLTEIPPPTRLARTRTPGPTPSPVAPYPPGSSAAAAASGQGLVILAIDEGAYTHLFAYQPLSLPFTRLTAGQWDDGSPALSPDGRLVAFASNRSGYWDLYLLDLESGQTNRLTDSLAYESGPSWSPDGRWLVYESYESPEAGGLELFIRPLDGSVETVRLTEHPAADYSPAWSPGGRQIAFVSNRSGLAEVWLADLDLLGDERFRQISQNGASVSAHPAWSPDGSRLAWAEVDSGYHNLVVWELVRPQVSPRLVGSGDWPAWSPDGKNLLTVMLTPNQSYLAAYPVDSSGVVLPPIQAPGWIAGLSWQPSAFPVSLAYSLQQTARLTPTPLTLPRLVPAAGIPGDRAQLVRLVEVEAPYPMLHDMVDEAFTALRENLAVRIGWDFLASLENSYIPLTAALDPGRRYDWLYTGRAFAFNASPASAGWLAVVREDFGGQTFWRVYLRTRFQDGSAGVPLHQIPWDFNARYSGDQQAYERGGALSAELPAGYWLDFTQFALDYGWERQPALSTWLSAYPAARFNEFVMTGELDWYGAMLELYPPEALVTPTAVVPPTRSPTPAPRWYQSPTPTSTATPRPTLTPLPPTFTATAAPTETAVPSRTPTPRNQRSPTASP